MNDIERVFVISIQQKNDFNKSISYSTSYDDPLSVTRLALAIASHLASDQRLNFRDRAPMLGRVFPGSTSSMQSTDPHNN